MEIRIVAEFEHEGKDYKKAVIINSKQINDAAIDIIFKTISEQANLLPYVPNEYNSFDMLRHILGLFKSVKRDIDAMIKK